MSHRTLLTFAIFSISLHSRNYNLIKVLEPLEFMEFNCSRSPSYNFLLGVICMESHDECAVVEGKAPIFQSFNLFSLRVISFDKWFDSLQASYKAAPIASYHGLRSVQCEEIRKKYHFTSLSCKAPTSARESESWDFCSLPCLILWTTSWGEDT